VVSKQRGEVRQVAHDLVDIRDEGVIGQESDDVGGRHVAEMSSKLRDERRNIAQGFVVVVRQEGAAFEAAKDSVEIVGDLRLELSVGAIGPFADDPRRAREADTSDAFHRHAVLDEGLLECDGGLRVVVEESREPCAGDGDGILTKLVLEELLRRRSARVPGVQGSPFESREEKMEENRYPHCASEQQPATPGGRRR